MSDLPKCAMEEIVDPDSGDTTYRPIEAPPCGARLDINERNVHLTCDHLPGHHQVGLKHRAVVDAAAGYALHWCWDDCANKCDHALANCLKDIREQIKGDWSDG